MVEVVAAIIRKDHMIFATQRGYGKWKDWWEFPGGKMEPGETPQEALIREIQEELSTEIRIDKFLCTIDYDYPDFHLTMHCYMCSLLSDSMHLNEHEAARWLSREDINSVKWLPADEALIQKIIEELNHNTMNENQEFDPKDTNKDGKVSVKEQILHAADKINEAMYGAADAVKEGAGKVVGKVKDYEALSLEEKQAKQDEWNQKATETATKAGETAKGIFNDIKAEAKKIFGKK